MEIKDRVAVITGGGGGIGSAVARKWAAMMASVDAGAETKPSMARVRIARTASAGDT